MESLPPFHRLNPDDLPPLDVNDEGGPVVYSEDRGALHSVSSHVSRDHSSRSPLPLSQDPVAAAVFLARRAPPTGRSLFLSGLQPETDFTELQQLYAEFGELISCRVLRDAKTGQSRCIGYVNFKDSEAAMKALSATDGTPGPNGGGPLTVKFADHDPSFTPEATTRVFVRFLPLNASVDEVKSVFEPFGPIIEIAISRDLSRAAKKEPDPWNLAYVTFSKPDDASHAVAATDRRPSILGPHPLVVKPAENPVTRQLRHEWRAAAVSSLRSASSSNPSSAQPTPKGIATPQSLFPIPVPSYSPPAHLAPTPDHSGGQFAYSRGPPPQYSAGGFLASHYTPSPQISPMATNYQPVFGMMQQQQQMPVHMNVPPQMHPPMMMPPNQLHQMQSQQIFVRQPDGTMVPVGMLSPSGMPQSFGMMQPPHAQNQYSYLPNLLYQPNAGM